jgi:chemotaxis protein MotB
MKNYYILFIALFFTNCVSKKQYDSLLQSKDILQKDFESLKDARRERQAYADSLVRMNSNFTTASQEAEDWKNRYLSLYTTNEALNKEISGLRYQNEQLQNTAASNNEALRTEIANRMKELDAREKDLRLMESDMKNSQGTINDLKKFLSDKELKIKDLSDNLNAKDAQMNDLRTKIAEILRGFNTGELTVRQENGKVYVALSENLLFAKGSSAINPRGIDALKKLASALNVSNDVDIQVEGHTDSDGVVDQNWSLSTSRALSVVKILTTNKVDAKRITASGRAFFHPIAPNDSEINKAKNRRTEIILSPQLDVLYNIIKDK